MSPSQKRPDVFALNSCADDCTRPLQATGQLSCPDKISEGKQLKIKKIKNKNKNKKKEGKQLSVFPELLFSDACVYVLPFTGVKIHTV